MSVKSWVLKRFILNCMGGEMAKIKNALAGYKVYIVCAAAILTAIGAYASDAMTAKELVETIFAALAAMGFRSAMANP